MWPLKDTKSDFVPGTCGSIMYSQGFPVMMVYKEGSNRFWPFSIDRDQWLFLWSKNSKSWDVRPELSIYNQCNGYVVVVWRAPRVCDDLFWYLVRPFSVWPYRKVETPGSKKGKKHKFILLISVSSVEGWYSLAPLSLRTQELRATVVFRRRY